MARVIGKDKAGNDVLGYDFQGELEVKAVGDNELEIVGSTAIRDRDDEVIVPEGIDLRNYKNNPVVLPQHDYWQPPIAKTKNVKLKDGRLIFRIEFPDEGINPVSDIYRKLYKAGFMNASSIGFIPKEWTLGRGDKDPRRTFTKVELLEISLVSVPANPQALVTEKSIQEAMSKGIISKEDVDKASNYRTKPSGDPEGKAVTETEEEDGDWTKDFKDADALMQKVGEVIQEKLDEFSKSIIRTLKDAGALDKSEEHYSKILFGGPEIADDAPKDAPHEVKAAAVVNAVKEVLGKELRL